MSVIIAGERSGVGKTTVTLAILSFLSQKGCKVQSFKTGPDYIDPMFHTAITGRPCRNLDPILTSENYVRSCFNNYSQNVEYTLIEGVMGLFDGVKYSQINDYASTAHIARLLGIPVILVLDCSRLSTSIAAIAHGYRSFDPRINLAGIILNKVGTERHLELLKEALLPLEIPILGVLYRHDLLTIPARHLGLVPTAELPQLNQLFIQLATLAQDNFDWPKIFPLLTVSNSYPKKNNLINTLLTSVKIAVANDAAFSFYYQDNLDILKQLGAEIIFWSPISDRALPEGIHGLYLGGGFPEIFAQALSDNREIKQAIKNRILSGMPTYAECGGLMYLCEHLIDLNSQTWPMVGILPTSTQMAKNLTLGYRQATAQQDSSFLNKGSTLWGHEFHRSQVTSPPQFPLLTLRGLSNNAKSVAEGWTMRHLHASYLHVHFGGYLASAQRFLNYCLAFSQSIS